MQFSFSLDGFDDDLRINRLQNVTILILSNSVTTKTILIRFIIKASVIIIASELVKTYRQVDMRLFTETTVTISFISAYDLSQASLADYEISLLYHFSDTSVSIR